MGRIRRQQLETLRCRLLRGVFIVGLLPKLLIPIGFMPVALADGGPFAICGDFGALPVAQIPGATPVAHAEHGAMSMARAGHGDTHAHAMVGEVPTDSGHAGDHGDEHDQHHQWERCSFAGAASAAPVAVDVLGLVLEPAAAGAMRPSVRIEFGITRFLTFQSRAPPLTHS